MYRIEALAAVIMIVSFLVFSYWGTANADVNSPHEPVITGTGFNGVEYDSLLAGVRQSFPNKDACQVALAWLLNNLRSNEQIQVLYERVDGTCEPVMEIL